MAKAECNVCGEVIKAGLRLKIGQRLSCPACKAVLEIVGLDPLELDWLYFDHSVDEGDYLQIRKARLAECPLCRCEFNIPQKLQLGQYVLCTSCDVELEVAWLDPIELSWPYGDGYQYNRGFRDDFDYIANDVA